MPPVTILLALVGVLSVVGAPGPQRFVVTANGTLEIGTCDASMFQKHSADGKPITVHLPPLPGEIRFELSGNRKLGPEYDLPRQRTCDGAVFRRYSAGRLATRDTATGEVRVAFDAPRLAPGYGRLHFCSSATTVYYMSTYFVLEPKHAHHLMLSAVPHDLMPFLPRRGHPDAASDLIKREFCSKLLRQIRCLIPVL